MAVMMILDWEGVTPEQYAQVNDMMGIHSDADAPDGLISHVAAIDDDGELTIVDLWESEEALGRFYETRLGPALAEVGIPESQPRIHPVHNEMHGGRGQCADPDRGGRHRHRRLRPHGRRHAGAHRRSQRLPVAAAFGRHGLQRLRRRRRVALRRGVRPVRRAADRAGRAEARHGADAQKTLKVHNHLRSQ